MSISELKDEYEKFAKNATLKNYESDDDAIEEPVKKEWSKSELESYFKDVDEISCWRCDERDNLLLFDFKKTFGFDLEAPRPRGFSISTSEPFAYSYGRCGSGNRKNFMSEILEIEKLPECIYADEDDYDETYMDFYFQLDESKWKPFIERWTKFDKEFKVKINENKRQELLKKIKEFDETIIHLEKTYNYYWDKKDMQNTLAHDIQCLKNLIVSCNRDITYLSK